MAVSEKEKQQVLIKKQIKRNWVNKCRENTCCLVCGKHNKEYEPLQFHHVVGEKKASITKIVNTTYSFDTLQCEMNKCVSLCKECHYNIHYDKKFSDKYPNKLLSEYAGIQIKKENILRKNKK